MIIHRNIFLVYMHTHTHFAATDLKLSLQSKSLDEGVSHMIEPLEARCSLVLKTWINTSIILLYMRKDNYKNVNNPFGWRRVFFGLRPTKIMPIYEKHFVWSLVGWAPRMLWHLFTHPDLPVQDISGDVDCSHGLTTKHKLGSGLEIPEVRAQMTFTLFFSRMSCKENIELR